MIGKILSGEWQGASRRDFQVFSFLLLKYIWSLTQSSISVLHGTSAWLVTQFWRWCFPCLTQEGKKLQRQQTLVERGRVLSPRYQGSKKVLTLQRLTNTPFTLFQGRVDVLMLLTRRWKTKNVASIKSGWKRGSFEFLFGSQGRRMAWTRHRLTDIPHLYSSEADILLVLHDTERKRCRIHKI